MTHHDPRAFSPAEHAAHIRTLAASQSEIGGVPRGSMRGLAMDCGTELMSSDLMPDVTDLGVANHPSLGCHNSGEPWYCAGDNKNSLRTSDGNWWEAARTSIWDLAGTSSSTDDFDYDLDEEPIGDDEQDKLDAIQDRHLARLEAQRAQQRAQRERRNALAAVSTNPLCSVHGFTPEAVIELDVAQAAVVLQAIKLLNELCDLLRALRPDANQQMVTKHACKLIGWNKKVPNALTGFDLKFLFEKSSTLADAVALRKQRLKQREEERKAYAQERQKKSRIAPRRTARTRQPQQRPPAAEIPIPKQKPNGAGWGGMMNGGEAYQCVCCGYVGLSTRMRALPFDVIRSRMGGQRVQAHGLWQHVICQRCDRQRPGLRTYQAESQRKRMLESDQAQATRTQRKRSHQPRMTGGMGGGINRNKKR